VKIIKLLRRFLIPGSLITLIYFIKYRCMISPKAEVELSPFFVVGKKTMISSFCKIKTDGGPLTIGSNVSIGPCCFISSSTKGVEIGNDCLIGPNVSIIGNKYKYDKLETPICLQEKTSEGIKIGRNVWVGAGTVIIDGAKIGDNVILGPNSVVTKSIPDHAIAQGNPAKAVFIRR